jgi:hypothetical protein
MACDLDIFFLACDSDAARRAVRSIRGGRHDDPAIIKIIVVHKTSFVLQIKSMHFFLKYHNTTTCAKSDVETRKVQHRIGVRGRARPGYEGRPVTAGLHKGSGNGGGGDGRCPLVTAAQRVCACNYSMHARRDGDHLLRTRFTRTVFLNFFIIRMEASYHLFRPS